MTLSPARFFSSEALKKWTPGMHQEETPRYPRLEASYEDMTPGGQPKNAELTLNLDTLEF